MLLLNQLGRLGIEVPQFLEIGVCHPLIRNNTFLLNLLFSKSNKYRGVLVEANPLCWDLIKAYRHNDILIQGGVSPTEGEMEFYIFPNKLGFCTFNKAIADKLIEKGEKYQITQVKTKNINRIIEENFECTPDVLSLDAEGLDFEILCNLDLSKHPIRIILCEAMKNHKAQIINHLKEHGYSLRATTWENQMWVRP